MVRGETRLRLPLPEVVEHVVTGNSVSVADACIFTVLKFEICNVMCRYNASQVDSVYLIFLKSLKLLFEKKYRFDICHCT